MLPLRKKVFSFYLTKNLVKKINPISAHEGCIYCKGFLFINTFYIIPVVSTWIKYLSYPMFPKVLKNILLSIVTHTLKEVKITITLFYILYNNDNDSYP